MANLLSLIAFFANSYSSRYIEKGHKTTDVIGLAKATMNIKIMEVSKETVLKLPIDCGCHCQIH